MKKKVKINCKNTKSVWLNYHREIFLIFCVFLLNFFFITGKIWLVWNENVCFIFSRVKCPWCCRRWRVWRDCHWAVSTLRSRSTCRRGWPRRRAVSTCSCRLWASICGSWACRAWPEAARPRTSRSEDHSFLFCFYFKHTKILKN